MSRDHVVRLGLIQHACPASASKRQDLDKACDMIRQAAGRGAQIVATQELFTTSYFPQVQEQARFALAEPVPGPTTDRLCGLAKQLDIEITASLFEQRAAGVYHNTSVMIGAGGTIIGRYRKMHIPDDPRFYEKYYFTPGDPPGSGEDGGFGAHRTRHATIGMLVCWDQWFPEAARLTALRGAQILFYPTAIGWYHAETDADRKQQLDAWRVIQRSHAIANGVFVAAINRVGVEHDLTFWGSSFVCDPAGQVIAAASGDQEQVLMAECDLGRIDQLRQSWPFLRDRRIDAYGGLCQRLIDP